MRLSSERVFPNTQWTLWPACVKTASFVEQIQAAQRAGYDRLPIGYLTLKELMRQGMSCKDIRQLAAEEGIALGHFDGFTDWAPQRFAEDLAPAAKAVFDVSTEDCLGYCAELGLTEICATGAFNPGQFPVSQLADCFAVFCEQAKSLGIRVDLEFIPMWGIPSLSLATDIVKRGGACNSGVLFDSWHHFRSGGTLTDVEVLDTEVITCVQLADASLDVQGDLLNDCLHFRRLPGQGELPLVELCHVLANQTRLASVGPEIFSDALDKLPTDEAATQAGQATNRVLSAAGWSNCRR